MKRLRSLLSLLSLLASSVVIGTLPSSHSLAQQLSPDGSANTVVRQENNRRFVVETGTLRDSNLFHSFETFSPENWSVVFDLNDPQYDSVDRVISRVTGQEKSYINGNLQILGGNSPDLLLINPAGISFGTNAQLQIEGSFLASTAESIAFENYSFTTQNPQAVPLLSVSAPIGLQMGDRSQSITYQGAGHSLAAVDPIFSPYLPTAAPTGLAAQPGKTISLVGNSISLEGGTIAAPNGQIELLSIADKRPLLFRSSNANSDYRIETIQGDTFSDISLNNRSLLYLSGTAPGEILLRGRDINLQDNSVILSQNQGWADAGEIAIEASNRFSLTSQYPEMNILSSVKGSSLSLGKAADIRIESDALVILDGNHIESRTFGPGSGGNISINTRSLQVDRYAQAASNIFSRIGSNTLSTGSGGSTLIIAEDIWLTEGGYIGSATVFSNGQGGNIQIRADNINISGATPTGELSLITATSIGGNGNAGNIEIETNQLAVSDSGSIITSSFGAGSSGNITIRATEQINVLGQRKNFLQSSITSGVIPVPPNYEQLIGTTQVQTGDAGSIDIETRTLKIDPLGILNVANLGTGKAGKLNVEADEIILRAGEISAATASGQGGEIALSARTLRASQGSLIQATSLGAGDGGNISIESDFIVGRENSDIIANAVDGRGGSINITTDRIFGYQPNAQLTAGSDITASSDIGVAGTIEIADTGLDVNAEVIELPAYFSDVDNQVVADCSNAQGNRFVASGRGGLRLNPSDRINALHPWTDTRASRNQTAPRATVSEIEHPEVDRFIELFEATSWQENGSGTIELVAAADQLK